MRGVRLLLALLLLTPFLILHPALAQPERPWAEEVADFDLRAVPAKVKPGVAQAFFHREGSGCPQPTQACRRPAYVTAGDEVVVFLYEGRRPAFVRALYRARANGPMTVGLLAAADLVIDDTARPVARDALLGTWSARIRRSENEAGLRIRPNAAGGIDFTIASELVGPDGAPIQGAPVRETSGSARVSSDPYVTYTAARCQLRMIPVGRYLLVVDEADRCADGGETVRYTGLYLRTQGESRPSGQAVSAAPAIEGYATEANVSRVATGAPYRSARQADMAPAACAQLCSGDRPCAGFTLMPGVVGVSPPTCHLLGSAGKAEPAPGAVSGLRQAR